MEEGGGQTADDGTRSPGDRTTPVEYAKVAEVGVVVNPAAVVRAVPG
jgi:hypothetical protein